MLDLGGRANPNVNKMRWCLVVVVSFLREVFILLRSGSRKAKHAKMVYCKTEGNELMRNKISIYWEVLGWFMLLKVCSYLTDCEFLYKNKLRTESKIQKCYIVKFTTFR